MDTVTEAWSHADKTTGRIARYRRTGRRSTDDGRTTETVVDEHGCDRVLVPGEVEVWLRAPSTALVVG